MRRLLVLALVLAGTAIPGCAQRGGARGGFSGGGARGGFSGASGGAHYGGGPTGGARSYAAVPSFRGYTPALRTVQPAYGARPVYSTARRGAYPVRRPLYAGNYPYSAYPTTAWFGPGYLDYDDSEDYNPNVTAPSNYVETVPEDQPYVDGQSQVYPPQQAYAPQPQPAPQPEDAVTLIFKDGRPPQQIHNYMLTRTTLTVTDGHRMRDVAVVDLDLAATEKANRDAGVVFKLPEAN